MVLYGLSLTPLAEAIRTAVPRTVQPWYADDAAVAGPLSSIATAQRLLLQLGPRRKSIIITPLVTPSSALDVLDEFNFQKSNGHRYLGGFVGSGATEAAWIDPKIDHWVASIKSLSMVARQYPQTAYAGFAHSLQAEWQYLQRVTPNIDQAFAPVEEAISYQFLPALFDASVAEIATLRQLLALPVRHGGLRIPDPTTTGAACFLTSNANSSRLKDSLIHGTDLCAQEHRRIVPLPAMKPKLAKSNPMMMLLLAFFKLPHLLPSDA